MSAAVEHALVACERVRRAIEQHTWATLHPLLQVTASIGVADNREAEAPEAVFALADRRLYQAKHAGRNRVVGLDVDVRLHDGRG